MSFDKMSRLLIFVGFTAFLYLKGVEGLECITCYYTKSPGEHNPVPDPFGGLEPIEYHSSCGDGHSPDSKLSKPCPDDNSVCFKAIPPLELQKKGNDPQIVRGCVKVAESPRLPFKQSCSDIKNGEKKENGVICTCSTKDCNGASLLAPGFLSVLAILIKSFFV